MSRQEAQWVLRAQCDDREALELLLKSVQPSLHRYLRSLVGIPDADDVLQEVLILIYRKLGWLENPELFRPWALRIANRAGLRWLKKHKRWSDEQRDELPPEDLAAPEVRPPDELLAALPTINGVSPASRAVLVLHFQEDRPLSEVAAILEIPLGTVKSRLAYGLSALRAQLSRNRKRSV